MHFRTRSVADTVVERIIAAAKAVESGSAPQSVQLSRAELPDDQRPAMDAGFTEVESAPVNQQDVQAQFDQQSAMAGGGGDLPGLDESGLDVGTILSGGNAIDAGLERPHGCGIDRKGDLYIADGINHRIRVVDLATQQVRTVPLAIDE